MAELSPLRRRMIEDEGDPEHVAGDTAVYISAVPGIQR